MPKKSVYVVDDDSSVRRALSRLLRVAVFDVETFSNAEAFLASELPEPACLVVDVHLPGMDGVELQRCITERTRGLPVVTISGHGEEATRRRALDAGASAFLDKPFGDGELLDAIAQAMSTHSSPGAPESDEPL